MGSVGPWEILGFWGLESRGCRVFGFRALCLLVLEPAREASGRFLCRDGAEASRRVGWDRGRHPGMHRN